MLPGEARCDVSVGVVGSWPTSVGISPLGWGLAQAGGNMSVVRLSRGTGSVRAGGLAKA